MTGTALSSACADAHRSMGYVHKLRLEGREHLSVEQLELREHDTRTWTSLTVRLAGGVLVALTILGSVILLQ